jgi:hypothetical protein
MPQYSSANQGWGKSTLLFSSPSPEILDKNLPATLIQNSTNILLLLVHASI